MMIHQDTIYQYLDGKDLLHVTLTERQRLLQELGQLAIAHLEASRPETVMAFPLVRAQTLLFELSVISEYIDALIVEVNSYAERCGKPRVERIETEPQ
jgi:hypothetical protein